MKTIKLFLILLITITGVSTSFEAKAQPGISVNFNTFYNDLGPYGRWIDHPRYGQVWVYNEPGFRPYYSNGHWEYTDYGWEWVSDYDWGWAPFHYGRWEEDPELGWVWIPGYDWAPAWVSWSQYDGYYGWAPLGYGVGFDVSLNVIPSSWWVYAPREYIMSPMIRNYCVPFDRSRYFVRNSVVINNYYNGREGHRFMMGPQRQDVERFTHERIEPRRVDDRWEWHGRNERGNGFRPDNGPGRNGDMNRPYDNERQRRPFGYPQQNNGMNQRPDNGWHNENRGRQMPAEENNNGNQWRRGDYNQAPAGAPNGQRPQNVPAAPQRQPDPGYNNWRNNRPQGSYNNGGNFPQRQPNYSAPAPAPRPQQPPMQPNQGGGWHQREPQQNNQPNGGGNNGRGRFSERRG